MPKRRYSRWLKDQAARRERIRGAHKAGKTLAEIGKQFRISPVRVHQIVKAA